MARVSAPAAAARHARLFELIRQRNVAQTLARRATPPRRPDPLEAQLFQLAAERSLGPAPARKPPGSLSP